MWPFIIPKVEKKGSISNLCRGISNSWYHVEENIIWHIGNCLSVRVPQAGPLINHALVNVSLPDRYKIVSEFVLPNGAWDMGYISAAFPLELCNRIIALIPHSPSLEED